MAVRTRVGLRLRWPVQNAGVFVVYLSEQSFSLLRTAVETIRAALESSDYADLAERFVCERS